MVWRRPLAHRRAAQRAGGRAAGGPNPAHRSGTAAWFAADGSDTDTAAAAAQTRAQNACVCARGVVTRRAGAKPDPSLAKLIRVSSGIRFTRRPGESPESIRVIPIRVITIRFTTIRATSIRVTSIRVTSIRVTSIRVTSIRVISGPNPAHRSGTAA